MRIKALGACVLLLLAANAFGQDYAMTIHLSGGGTVTIPHADIQRITFRDILTAVQEPDGEGQTPSRFRLLGSFPNPFNPSTTIAYALPAPARVAVRIYDAKGALVSTLFDATQTAGEHQVNWDGRDDRGARVASGVYFCAVAAGESTLSQQLLLVK